MFNQMDNAGLNRRGFMALACVLLLSLASLIAASHVHTRASAIPERSCAVCAFAHAGIVPVQSSPLAFVLIASPLPTVPAVSSPSLLLPESLWIRPPPAV